MSYLEEEEGKDESKLVHGNGQTFCPRANKNAQVVLAKTKTARFVSFD